MGQQLTALQVALDAEKAKTANLQTWASDRVKYAYPNGGSEGDEKTLSLSSEYIVDSPFLINVCFHAVAEYYSVSKGEWVALPRRQYSASEFYGVDCYGRYSGLVLIKTGSQALDNIGFWSDDSAIVLASKWRVRCVRED
jgi:hypothetical protein